MNKKFLLILLLGFIIINSYAQIIRFNKDYNLPAGNNANGLYGIISNDTGYICIGVTQLNTPQSVLYFYIDSLGCPVNINSYIYNWISSVMSEESYTINDSLIYLSFLNKDFNYSPLLRRIMLYVFKGNDTLYTREITSDTIESSVTCVTKLDTFLYYSGWIAADPNNSSDGDYWLIKTTLQGDILWQKQYGGNSAESAMHLITTSDQNILISGYSHSFGNNSPYDNGQWYLVKVDTAGNVLWAKTYGNPNLNDHRPFGLTETRDSCYIITGSYAVGMYGSSEMLQGRILKIDKNGDIVWDKKKYGNVSQNTYFSIIKEKPNCNELIGVLNNSADIYYTPPYQNYYNPIIQCLTSTGEIKWFRSYYFNQDPTVDASVLNSFDFTADGGYIFAGYGMDYDSVPAQRSWVIKTDSLGFDGVTDFSADTAYRVELAADTCYGDTAVVVAHLYGVTAPYRIAYASYAIHDSLYYSPMYEPYIADTLFLTSAMLTTGDSILQIPVTVTDGLGRVLYDTLTVNVGCLVSGIYTTAWENAIKIYPNPANNYLMVIANGKLQVKTIAILNLTGKTIMASSLQSRYLSGVAISLNGHAVTVNIKPLPAGVYFVKVETDKSTVINKFIKQ